MEPARQFIAEYLPWLMSAITITAIELQGRKWPKAWALSLAGQVLWIVWLLATIPTNNGFAPMVAVLTFQYARNHLKWLREARVGRDEDQQPRLDHPCQGCMGLTRCMSAGYCITAKFIDSIERDGSPDCRCYGLSCIMARRCRKREQ